MGPCPITPNIDDYRRLARYASPKSNPEHLALLGQKLVEADPRHRLST
jgi:hypothetical protein